MLMRLLLLPMLAAADDTVCSFQKQPKIEGLLDLDTSPYTRVKNAHPNHPGGLPQDLWSSPGLGFRQCPTKSSVRTVQLLVRPHSKHSPEAQPKPKCLPKEVLIGDFVGDAYEFSCCDAGEQCGGCRAVKDGACQKCAAGYVMQTIPVLGTSKCFVCDDVPNWHDMHGQSCADLQKLGMCSGAWPKEDQDVAFQGVRPSEACCACGGGSIYPTPVYMPLQSKSLHFGQSIDETPSPITAGEQMVAPGCTLASSGLELGKDGRISGEVTMSNQTVIKCSTVSVQDPVRGIVANIDLSVPVSTFSYGQQTVFFKFWGLDRTPSRQIVRLRSKNRRKLKLTSFQLQCDPACPWLSITSKGDLLWNSINGHVPHGRAGSPVASDDLTEVTTLAGMPSCSCQVLATLQTQQVSTQFLAAQARLWKGAVWDVPSIVARISTEILEVPLLEDLGPGLRWYNRSGHVLQVPVVQNIETGETFVVSESISPTILDVDCKDHQGRILSWSRKSGEVMLDNELAFQLDPSTGAISGTPRLSLPATQGRAEVNVTCHVALGGPFYDQALPVAIFHIRLLDDVCWVPRNISGHFRWKEKSVQEPQCLQTCRLRDDCAAVQYKEDTCRFMVSDGKETFLDGQVLVRLNNCSEQDASLNLAVPGAQYLQGEFGVMNFYQNDASYSRAGSLPERQLVLGRRASVQRIPESCAKSSWFLLHINTSDFEDSTLINAPEFFGDTIACIDSDVVSKAFKHGQDAFDLRLLPREVESTPLYDQPPALQHGTLALGVPPCEKPSQDLLLGTLSEPGIYSLHPCECFGAAYASVEPVHEDSDAAVPRNPQGYFNNGSVSDQLLFSGPYTCEESASVGHFSHLEMDECQRACASKSECQFYLFGKTAQTCTLFQSCSYIQDVGLQITNEVYGMSPEFGSYCRIANPEQCWQEIKRRSMLSFTPSNLPSCLFQEQYEACDALQLLLGKQDGPCSRCQYIDASSAFAAVGLKKVPPPEDFPSASQILVSCNDTSRMFSRLQNGLRWEGPMQGDATFTCVSGEWVGELGPWQYLTNLTCQRCIQIGTGSLQRLSLVSMPEVYFLEHRQVHVNYPFATHGCARAGILTPSRLRPDVNVKVFLDVSKDNTLVLSAEPLAIWWIDALSEQLRVSSEALDSRKEWCICTDKPQLYTCTCGQSKKKHMEVNRGLLQDYYGLRCLRMDQTLKFEACPTGPREKFLWHFESGNCFFGFDLTNTAEKRWTATSEAESSKPLRLGNFAFKDIASPEAGLSQIYLDYLEMDAHLCLHADMSQPLGSGYVMQISDDCRSAFLWRGAHLVYFHHSDLKKSYYVQMASSGENQVLIATTQAISEADDKFEIFEGKLVRVGHPTKCLQAKKVEPVPLSNGLRSMVAGPSAPQYSPCTSYGEFSGDGEYYQVCRESPLVKKVQQQTFGPWVANREELPAFALRCLSARTVLTNISWPTSIPAPGYGGRIIGEVNATCAVLGSRNAVSSMRQERFPVKYNASSHFVNFSCPPDMVLDLVQFADDVHFMRCNHGWETLIAADPSSPSDVYFEDCSDIWTQSWSIQRIPQQNHSFSSWMELGSCEASLSVATQATNPDADAEFLNLSIPDLPQLSPKEKDAYTRSPAIHITTDDSDRLLFTCLPGQSKGPLLDGNLSTLCASHVALRRSDLFGATSLFKDNFQTLLTQKSCPVLMDPSISVGPSIARNTAKGGMTMQQLSHILRLAYYATPFGDPHKDPFNYTGYDAVFAERVGFVSLLQGGAPWGLKCPSGAVVASDQTTTPYCLQVGASSEQTFYAFSGSMSCPDGTAVSGWYNLPGIHVKGGPLGGPTNATKLRLYCRSTPLLSSCEQPTTSYCQGGRVVVSVSFDSNKFKLGCCQWQRRLGMALTESPRRTWTYKDFSGYYCPIGIDVTGAAAYEKTFIASMGSPQEQPVKAHQRHRIDTSMWTLSWNRFVEHWEIRQKGQLVASLPGDDATPVAANGTASAFSATFITPLTAAYVIASKPQSPFPKQKPMAPKLLAFHADQPDYKEYCDPAYLQNPSAFPDSESITQTNPCFHVFNSQPAQLQPEPKTPLLKGITEQAFWQCAERSKRRTYMSDFTVVNKAERDAAVKKAQKKISQITLALELTAMVSAMIPWGSYAEPGAKGAEVGQEELEDVAEEQLGRMAEQAAREVKGAAAKTFAQKLKDAARSAISGAARSAISGANRFVSSTLQKIRKKGPFKILLGQKAFKAGAQISKFFKASKNMKKPPSAGELKNMSQELITQTVPEMSESYTKDLTALAEASWKDCLPIQFGLSKVMCDLFCIDDAVRSGTSAVLESLEDSHNVLMTNIQALLDYQTQYLLGAIGTVLNPQTREDSQEHEILSASAVLQELREFPKHNAQNDDLTLNRDVLDWHRATGDELISRITAMSINASTASRPHRVRSLKGMLYHYRNSLHERLNGPTPSVASVAQRQIKDKLQLLSDQASEHRAVTRVAKSLRQKFPATVPLELSDQVVWSSILESFLHTQEKHDTFTMLHLKALDQMDYAVYLAQNFSQCAGADTALLREVWQRAMRAEDRCNEALLEAWSATMTTSERLEVATQDQGFLHNWVQHMDLGTLDDGEVLDDCENHTALVQRIYGMAVAKVSTSFQPLALQINTFKVLASYQERQLQHRRLDYVSAPTPPALSSMEELKSLVQAIAEPSSLEGQALAARATKVSEQFCPGEEFLLEDIILQAEPVKDLLLL